MAAQIKHMVLADHANIRQLMDQIERAVGTGGVGGRDRLFAQLVEELTRHAKLMSEVVAPVVGHSGDAYEDDRLIRFAGELAREDKGSDEWPKRFDSLRSDVDELFARHTDMLTGVDDLQSRRLAKDYARAKIKAIRAGGYVGRRWLGRSAAAVGSIAAVLAAGGAVFAWLRSRKGRRSDAVPLKVVEGDRETSIAAE